MKKFVRCLSVDFKYTIFSNRFLFACLGYAVISVLSISGEPNFTESAVSYLYMVYGIYPFWMLFLIFGAVPGAPSFCADWENRFFRSFMQRSGKRIYAVSKVITCFVSAFLLIFLAQWLFILFLRMNSVSMFHEQNASNLGGAFAAFMNERDIWKYFLARIIILSSGGGFFAVFALWFSTKITNIFVVYFSPLILYYVINNVTQWLQPPMFLSVSHIIKGSVSIENAPWLTVFYAVGLFSILTVPLAFAFYFDCKRRVENG